MAQTGGAGFGTASGRVNAVGARARASRRPYEGRVRISAGARAGAGKPSPLRGPCGDIGGGAGGFLVLSPQSSHLLAFLQELLQRSLRF